MTQTIERRYYRVGEQVDFRAASTDESRQLRGHAAVFNSLSEDLGGFREIIAPGAFERAIEEGDDTRALFNHDPNHVLGRYRKSETDTLRMFEDEIGLAVEIDLPDTSLGRDLYHLVERGDVSQMSFGFIVVDDEWRKVDGQNIRTIREVRLFDVSPVTYPAYEATDVSVRSQLPASSKERLAQLEGETADAEVESEPDTNTTNHVARKRLAIEIAERE